jgi:hypothetical protein
MTACESQRGHAEYQLGRREADTEVGCVWGSNSVARYAVLSIVPTTPPSRRVVEVGVGGHWDLKRLADKLIGWVINRDVQS